MNILNRRNTILLLLGFFATYAGLTSFNFAPIEAEDAPVPTVIFATESEETENDYYADFLEELAVPSPKEEEIFTGTSSTTVLSETPVSTKEVEVVEEYKEVKNIEPEVKKEAKEEKVAVGVVDHRAFGKLLKKYVDSKGNVNYRGFKNDAAALQVYLDQLSANPVSANMSKNERLAYWINAYNAYTIKLIIDNYPLKSITDLEGGKPWDKVFIKLGQASYSLNMIENEIIRKRFTEPRIHFAVNCAAASCPPLLNDAFYPQTLTKQLASQTSAFLNNSYYNTITSSKLELSKIFDWYGVDFKDVKNYVNSRVAPDISSLPLNFKEYDWSLNEQ